MSVNIFKIKRLLSASLHLRSNPSQL